MGLVAPIPEQIGTPTMLFCEGSRGSIFHREIYVKSTVFWVLKNVKLVHFAQLWFWKNLTWPSWDLWEMHCWGANLLWHGCNETQFLAKQGDSASVCLFVWLCYLSWTVTFALNIRYVGWPWPKLVINHWSGSRSNTKKFFFWHLCYLSSRSKSRDGSRSRSRFKVKCLSYSGRGSALRSAAKSNNPVIRECIRKIPRIRLISF